MARPGDDTLLLYLAEALDPGAQAAVEAWLRDQPSLRQRLEFLRAEPGPVLAEGGLRIPPPGFGLDLSAGQPRVMGPTVLRVGDRFQIHLAARPTPDTDGVVVLRDLGTGWQVLTPSVPERALRLARLPIDDDGRHRVDLVARPPAGRQRWAVALLPVGDLPPDPSSGSDAWAFLHQGLEAGVIPVGVVEIDLRGA